MIGGRRASELSPQWIPTPPNGKENAMPLFKTSGRLQPLVDAPRNLQILMVIGLALVLISLTTLAVVTAKVAGNAH